MYLTREQERILNGEYGWVRAKALEIIIRVGEALNAEKLVGIKHAHVSGISYLNIGEPGLKLLEELAEKGGSAVVYTTVNPSCIDLLMDSRVIDQSIVYQQLLVNKALEKMGFNPTYTCIPYLHRPPSPGEHLAWGESNAVVMANSFYGAYTNREGGPLALAAALTGYTYYAGLHILDNRVARYIVDVEANLSESMYSALGLWIGENLDEIPLLVFRGEPSYTGLKLLFSASAASGSHGLIVVKDVTPRNTYMVDHVDRIGIDRGELEKYLVGEDIGSAESILGYIGCPHLHPYEFKLLTGIIRGYRRVKKGSALLISIPYMYREYLMYEARILKSRGVDVVFGTCPIVSRLTRRFDLVLTNSGKAWFYLSKLHGLRVVLMDSAEIIRRVMEK